MIVRAGSQYQVQSESGKPMGKTSQAWSAGMFLYADECVRSGRTPFLQ